MNTQKVFSLHTLSDIASIENYLYSREVMVLLKLANNHTQTEKYKFTNQIYN